MFGPDGRVRLSNPAFTSLWGLPEGLVKSGTHISVIKAAAQTLAKASPWGELAAAATGARMVVSMIGELERRDATLGVASMCAGGGMGSALVFERV